MVRKETGSAKIHLSEVSTIILQTMRVFISAYLMTELSKNKISLVISDEKCNPCGQLLPLYGSHNASKRVLEQIDWSEPIKKRVWQRIVRDKIRAQQRLLERYDLISPAKELGGLILDVKSGDSTGREAYAARLYFSALFGKTFSREFDLPVNAALNFGYAILLSMVNREIVSRGFLTQFGLCHHNEYNQFNFSCDLMEPFRPAIDQLVIDHIDQGLDPEMRKLLSNVGNTIVRYRNGSYKLTSVASQYVQQCLAALNKQLRVSEIDKFEFI